MTESSKILVSMVSIDKPILHLLPNIESKQEKNAFHLQNR